MSASASWFLVFAVCVASYVIEKKLAELVIAVGSLKPTGDGVTDDSATDDGSSVKDRLAVAQIAATLIAQHGTIPEGGYISLADRKRFIELAWDIYTDVGWAKKERMKFTCRAGQ